MRLCKQVRDRNRRAGQGQRRSLLRAREGGGTVEEVRRRVRHHGRPGGATVAARPAHAAASGPEGEFAAALREGRLSEGPTRPEEQDRATARRPACNSTSAASPRATPRTQALKLLSEKFGIKRALVAAAGDITCGDPPPGKRLLDRGHRTDRQEPEAADAQTRECGRLHVRRSRAVRRDRRRAVFAHRRPEDRSRDHRPPERHRDRDARRDRGQHDESRERALSRTGIEASGRHTRRGRVYCDPGQGGETHRHRNEAVRPVRPQG